VDSRNLEVVKLLIGAEADLSLCNDSGELLTKMLGFRLRNSSCTIY